MRGARPLHHTACVCIDNARTSEGECGTEEGCKHDVRRFCESCGRQLFHTDRKRLTAAFKRLQSHGGKFDTFLKQVKQLQQSHSSTEMTTDSYIADHERKG